MSTFRSSLFNFDVRDPVQIVRQTTQLPQTPLDLKDIRVAVLAIGLLVSFPQMIQFSIYRDRHVCDKVDQLTSFHFLGGPVHTVDSKTQLKFVLWIDGLFLFLHYHYRHHHDHHPYHDYIASSRSCLIRWADVWPHFSVQPAWKLSSSWTLKNSPFDFLLQAQPGE